MKEYWFRAKHYGWGWYLSSWQGLVITLGYIVALVLKFKQVDRVSHSISDTLIGAALPFFILTSILIAVCYATGERPRWRWGRLGK